jgi:two-component system sensor histidine kinase PilS (NtrC family)
VLANLSWALYAALVLSLSFSWIPAAAEQPPDRSFLTYNLIVHFLGFNAVAMLVSYVAKNVTKIQVALEQKQEDLEELESFHRDITNSLSSGLLTTDLDGRVITMNPAGEQILKRNADDVLGEPVFEIGVCHHDEWKRVTATSRSQGRQREESRHGEGEETVWIGYSVTPLHEADGRQRGYIVIFQDFTPWRLLEQQVRMNDRMAAIGELSAGIAHELRNPLAAISGSVQVLSSTLETSDARRRLFDIIVDESRRLDRTIEGFLKFSRPPEKSEARFDVAELLAENVELLGNSEQVSESHEVRAELDPPSAFILADKDQISQIFWNLARNALSAMPDGGTLVVAGSLSGETYRIRFRDTGRGMTEDERRTMFHPFKTTFHSGTGLGMAIVYRLVQEHGGQLQVDSELGHGTTVTVELPLGQQARAAAPVEA